MRSWGPAIFLSLKEAVVVSGADEALRAANLSLRARAAASKVPTCSNSEDIIQTRRGGSSENSSSSSSSCVGPRDRGKLLEDSKRGFRIDFEKFLAKAPLQTAVGLLLQAGSLHHHRQKPKPTATHQQPRCQSKTRQQRIYFQLTLIMTKHEVPQAS